MVGNNKLKLNEEIILKLLAEADTKWYNNLSSHPSHKYNYREHLEFTAEYIAKNYNKKSKRTDNHNHNRRRTSQAGRRKEKLL